MRWLMDVKEDSISPTTTEDEGGGGLEEDRNTVPPPAMEIVPVDEDVSTGSVNVQSPSIEKEKKQKVKGKADGAAVTVREYTDAVGDLDALNVVNNKMEMDDDDSSETFLPPPSLGDVVQSLIRQAKKRTEDYSKAYRRSILESLSKILNCLSAKDCQAFEMVAPTVVPLTGLSIAAAKILDGIATAESVEGCDEDPVLQLRALELLCSAWRGDAGASYSSGNIVQAILADLHPTMGRVWSVQVALLLFLEKVLLLDSSAPKTNRSINGTQIDSIVFRASGFIADSKFTAVQKAGADICSCLIRRHHERPFEMLPHKEALTLAAEKASRSGDPDVAAIGAKAAAEAFLWH